MREQVTTMIAEPGRRGAAASCRGPPPKSLKPRTPGEWPGGIAPPGSRRTRREGLPSPGSHRPTLGARDEVPVDEEPGLTLTDSVQPGPGLLGPAAQSLVLLHGPPDQVLVDARCDGIQPGAVEGSVVADPASYLGIDVLGEARQVRGTAAVEVPGPDLLADRFSRLGAHGRVEAHEEASLAANDTAPEGVAEEIEADMLRGPPASRVLAVHDFRLPGVQLKAQGPEPAGDRVTKLACLCLAVAVRDNIISVTLERAARIFPAHPRIERIVHEEISQQRGNR